MKKLIALLLVVMMLGSTVAFADENASIQDYVPTQHETADGTATKLEGTTTDGPRTELWLQVDATGQIDVTVPLVLVFKTDIDGGEATSPDTYKIKNNNHADLVVTKIGATETAQTHIDLVSSENFTNADDTYMVTLSVEGVDTWDVYTATQTPHAADQLQGGLFGIDGDDETVITAFMETGELNFVTARKTTGEGDAAVDAGMDTTKGVQLLTVTYTVAIDTSEAVASDPITGGVDTKDQPINNPASTPNA